MVLEFYATLELFQQGPALCGDGHLLGDSA